MTQTHCRTLMEGLQAVAKWNASGIALRCGDQSVTYQELCERACQVGNGLASHSLGEGDRVAIVSRDSIASYELFFGCTQTGCVLVPINWRLTGKELAQIIRDSQAKLLIVDSASHDKLLSADHELLASMPVRSITGFEAWRSSFTTTPTLSFSASADSPSVQIYTSGTTGLPKGVVLPHRTFFDLLAGMRTVGDNWMGLGERDVLLLSLPQFHIGGLWWAVQGLMAGSCGVLMESFVGWQALQLIEQQRITKVAMVPAMIQFCLAEPDIETVDLTSVTGFLYGGSPIAPQLLKRAMDRFACPFFQIYGLTETGNTAVCLRPEDHSDPALWKAAGRAYHGVELKIIDAQQNALPHGSVGEIWIKSPSVMLGYWNNPRDTMEVLHDGWIRTGDAGYLNDQGYLFVCDRLKDMIIYAGENIYPAEVEAALLEHPAIAEAAVIGIPDDQFGEKVKAILVQRSSTELPKTRELLQHCRQRLADYKIPKSFEFVDAIPRNPSGKILKQVLRKPHWENQERQVN